MKGDAPKRLGCISLCCCDPTLHPSFSASGVVVEARQLGVTYLKHSNNCVLSWMCWLSFKWGALCRTILSVGKELAQLLFHCVFLQLLPGRICLIAPPDHKSLRTVGYGLVFLLISLLSGDCHRDNWRLSCGTCLLYVLTRESQLSRTY